VATHLTVQPSVKLYMTRQTLRAPRASRQLVPTAAGAAADIDKTNSTTEMSMS
jgi:hypothetical protein